MDCSDVDRILPDIIDGTTVDGTGINGDQDPEFQSHLRTCSHCSELVSDLKLIASEARELSHTEEPSPRVWLRIAAELRAEGLIRDPELTSAGPVLVAAPKRRWRALWLAPVAAAILAAGSYVLIHKSPAPATPQTAQAGAQQPATQTTAKSETQVAQQGSNTPGQKQPETQIAQQTNRARARHAAASEAPQTPPEQAELSAPPSADDQEFLSEVSSRAPTMRATYENQLRAVNTEIRETQAYVNRYPGDMDARQHLLEVYQQKAMLYQMALDRIQ
ncbi:MAG: hypothetical protein WA172_19045 [Terriglobales bacterium]